MWYVVTLFVGIVTGAACAILCLLPWAGRVKQREKTSQLRAKWAEEATANAAQREPDLALREQVLARASAEAEARCLAIDQQVISYTELQGENAILKRDLLNLDMNVRKADLDGEARQRQVEEVDARSQQLAKRYLTETVKAVVAAVGPDNFTACKSRLADAIERVRGVGFLVTDQEGARLRADLKAEFEQAVRAEFERQEQARIKAQIREEEKLKREVERELKQLERERLAVQAALDQALAAAHGQHSAEVDRLKARLAEAEAKAQRTLSMAQQTKAGHVYVISNIGTFGVGVYKVGMTRRLDPNERICELGDASVPFPFDVHMMIHCEDAPALENALHRALHKLRVNRVNPRKEFFRVDLAEIVRIVKDHHGEVQYVADPEALQYRQSLTVSEEDAEYIEKVFETVEGNTEFDEDENCGTTGTSPE